MLFLFSCHRKNTSLAQKENSVSKIDSSVFKKVFENPTYVKASSYSKLKKYDSALIYFTKLSDEYARDKHNKSYQYSLCRLIWTYVVLGKYQMGHAYFNRLTELYPNVDTTDLIDAYTYKTAGLLFHYYNKPDSAIYFYNISRNIYSRILGLNCNDVADCDSKIGDVYLFLKLDYYDAQKYYLNSIRIFELLGDKRDKYLYYTTLYNLSSTNRHKGDYIKALQYAYKTLDYTKQFSDSVALIYTNGLIANIYAAMQDFENAIQYIQNAIRFNTSQWVYLRIQKLDNFSKLSDYYLQIGRYDLAIETGEKVLYLLKHQKLDNTEKIEANLFDHIGLSYLYMEKRKQALDYLEGSLKRRINYYGIKNSDVAKSYDFLGKYYDVCDKPDSALICYQKAIMSCLDNFNSLDIFRNPTFEESINKDELPIAINNKAIILSKIYNKDRTDTASLFASFNCYVLEDSLITYARKTMDSEQSKMTVSIDYHLFYENAIECAYLCFQLTKQKQFVEKAFRFFEKNKYLLLLEKFTAANLANQGGIPDSLALTEKNLNEKLNAIQDEFSEESKKLKPDSSKLNILNNKIYSIIRQSEELKLFFEQHYPAYFKLKHEDIADNLSDVETYSALHKSNIIQYFWGDSSIFILGINGNNYRFLRISNSDQLKDTLFYFIRLLQEPIVNDFDKFSMYRIYGYKIYSTLVLPALLTNKAENLNFNTLTIIPDGLLTKVAFEALVDSITYEKTVNYKSLSYLVRRYNIQYEYSSNLMLATSDNNRPRDVRNILGFAYSTESEKNYTDKRSGFNAIPGSSKEMKVISGFRDARIFSGADATESNFKKFAPLYDIIHIAIHGVADEKGGNDTRLVFRNEKDSTNDGELYPDEIYGLNLRAKLVVLSACETGIGKTFKGEGVFSMARAFAYAGCPSVVISLWKANDMSTVELMKDFYKNLRNKTEIGQSLTAAKLSFLSQADEYTAHPAYWASFVAFGDMSPLKQVNYYLVSFFVLGIALVLSLLTFYLIRRRYKRK